MMMSPEIRIDVPDVSVLSYDEPNNIYVDVTDHVEITVSRSMTVSGMVSFMFRASVQRGKRINDIALRMNDLKYVEALDQFCGHVAVMHSVDSAYRIYPIFLTQIQAEKITAVYLRQHAGTFKSFYADVDDVIQIQANWIA